MVEIDKKDLHKYVNETITFVDEDMVKHDCKLIDASSAWIKFLGKHSKIEILYEKLKDKILVTDEAYIRKNDN